MMFPAAVAGLAAAAAARRRCPRPGTCAAAGVAAGLLLVAPPVALGLVVAAGAWLMSRRLRARRLEADGARGDLVMLADLLSLGLGAGLGLPLAMEEAAREVAGPLAEEITSVRRAMDRWGVAAALASAPGWGERLYRLMGRAAATGAPLVGAVEAYALERRHAEHTLRLEAARRLPVRLVLPLALLILPGFVVLVLGPALLESLARLGVSP
jgi:tight adherence protein C